MRRFTVIIACCLLSCLATMGQSKISEIEYFFDTDPGVGNATKVAVSSTALLNKNVTVSVSNLSAGIHVLHVRSKNDVNQWSLYARQPFYIANFNLALNNTITQAEYFIDTDPGVGNATALNSTSGSSLEAALAIPLTTVSTGIHILHIRVKNSLNQWSLYARQSFYKSPQIVGKNIVAAEYFIDVDPGVGNGQVLSIAPGTPLNELLSIPLSTISEGIHILHIRVKNSANQWGMYARQVFYKSPLILGNDLIVAEYFIDVDPGLGAATPIPITKGQSLDEVLNITVPANLEQGDHVLHLRVQRSDNRWSLYGRPEFKTSLSVDNQIFENFIVYPNPVSDLLNLSLPNGTLEHIKIIDNTGKTVMEQTYNLQQLNVSNLAAGMYLLQIKTSNGAISKKIIKR